MKKDTIAASRRGEVTLVSVHDKRLAPFYTESQGGISGYMDGPTFLAIGRKLTDDQLRKYAATEGIDAAVLIKFRDSLKRRKAKPVDQAAINTKRDYKVMLMRVTGINDSAYDKMHYVVTEGKTDAEVASEKSALEAQGFSAVVWTASKELFERWRHECEEGNNNHGLPEAALEMLRTRFSVPC